MCSEMVETALGEADQCIPMVYVSRCARVYIALSGWCVCPYRASKFYSRKGVGPSPGLASQGNCYTKRDVRAQVVPGQPEAQESRSLPGCVRPLASISLSSRACRPLCIH